MQELFHAFPELLARFKDNDEILRAFVFTVWKRTAGQLLNARTKPAEFQNKRLTIAVENATWKQHLEDLTWVGVDTYFGGDIDGKLRATLQKELRLIEKLNYSDAAGRRIQSANLQIAQGALGATAGSDLALKWF